MNTKPEQLIHTIPHIDKWTLGDWIALAKAIDFKPMWAYNCWIDKTSTNLIQFGLGDWEAFAEALGQSEQWAYYRYKEFSASC